MKLHRSNSSKSIVRVSRTGFTLRELMVVIATLAVLGGLMLPALARSRSGDSNVQCLGNLRRLMLAWQMYSQDHNEALIMTFHGNEAIGGRAASNLRNAPWMLGWQDWGTSSDNTNSLYLTDSKYSKMAVYLENSAQVYLCPADTFLSPSQRARGWSSRSRSVSCSVGVGAGNA